MRATVFGQVITLGRKLDMVLCTTLTIMFTRVYNVTIYLYLQHPSTWDEKVIFMKKNGRLHDWWCPWRILIPCASELDFYTTPSKKWMWQGKTKNTSKRIKTSDWSYDRSQLIKTKNTSKTKNNSKTENTPKTRNNSETENTPKTRNTSIRIKTSDHPTLFRLAVH